MIHDISFHDAAREMIGIVGRTGDWKIDVEGERSSGSWK